MLKKLRDILSTYSTEELEEMGFWINASDKVSNILVEDEDIVLITEDADLRINGCEEH